MSVYSGPDFQVELKEDNSPLTLADKKAHEVIQKILSEFNIPIISEESKLLDHQTRKEWKECWIVDPLDGTKEFIKRNGEFTVNIALIRKGKPMLGVIFAPALNLLYFALVSEKKAYKVSTTSIRMKVADVFNAAKEISPMPAQELIHVAGSRSHMNEDTLNFIEDLKKRYDKEVRVISKGSSLKFCLVAEGTAQFYPRFAPTMEWDTAAGQAICEAVGVQCRSRSTGDPISYNRKNLLNDHFLVSNEG